MKLHCDVCAQAAATLFCCADEAALCPECDIHVHAANKLAVKHERLPLSVDCPPSSCDICQEKSGLFFCLEDRALLCRDCDLSIHKANKLTRKHKRFLVSGMRVGLDAMGPTCLPSKDASPHRGSVVVGLDTMASPSSKVASPHRPSVVMGLNTMSPQPSSSSLVESRSKDHCTESNNSRMECTHHMVSPPITMQPRILEFNNINTKESPPHLIPHLPLSRPSNLEPTNTLTSPCSSSFVYPFSCLVQLDELLNASPTSTTFSETPLMMSIPNAGWSALDSSFALDVLHASTHLFENSFAQVPSTPMTSQPPCFQDNYLKRKRHLDEPLYSPFDHTSVVPNTIFPQCIQRRNNF